MVESMNDKLNKLQKDLEQIEELYNFGTALHPYSKIRSPVSLNEQEERQNRIAMLQNGSLEGYFYGGALWGLTSILLLGLANQGSLRAFPNIFKSPVKVLFFYQIGVVINSLANLTKIFDSNISRQEFVVGRRVAKNQHSHSIVKVCLQQLEQRRMGLVDTTPR